ncbi:nuclear pore RNA shuttling protein Mtr2 [Yarrowia lipolytica]|jgi:NTF2-related export protein 1/2|uniref:YALI0B11132p n=2 Tax=Yarrowia lipolytica TaxID=4952 RepID=Q6CF15_YARLI|nr:YALI0B11132p [Yarrowia lipolytica CLIB122]AOW01536.1 hypothetical protein YALI1_B14804g [Yarrowia lipolytica]KAB8281108.1 nuclear pore RNA shuttling protein Mtr2 [Yarrowia lipolytica]KAE8170338.1 nuclear pore RNA shuttling protein Mtr2 [Yarrowia lipolytica]KAJ8052352.1 nuclear pore RNA shuttling protein Mtr2 [Yarrowia lipolytica]QNP96692.1 Hypothetical protein YALI2_C00345g [Yarrowia lipolytica]|eukprot:XP_500747.2 YALI0B11132p [Yarrowia lipolytica CLIB122]
MNTSNGPTQQQVTHTVTNTESFLRQFFKALDDHRQNLPQFLRPDTAIVWNGTPIAGRDAFLGIYAQMPATVTHDMFGFDCHGVNGGTIINATGRVRMTNERGKDPHGFSFTGMVRPDETQPPSASQTSVPQYLVSFSYRIVHRPEDSQVEYPQ